MIDRLLGQPYRSIYHGTRRCQVRVRRKWVGSRAELTLY